MSKSFLEYVSSDIIRKHGCDLSRTAVVFPNKRASLFMNECLLGIVDKPMWSPVYITISDLFRQHSRLSVADPIKLICDLHKSFTKYVSTQETLDHFYGWGQLLLADFDDIDKNMADAEMVFSNLRNLHELDDISYLTEEQRAILQRFFGNLNDGRQTELKKRFLNLWQHFGNIYTDFNERLLRQGLAYEGALYRKVVTDEKPDFRFDHYIFVGFNLLQKVEQKMFRLLKQEGKASFYWDFDRYYMPDKSGRHHEAGHFIAQYLEDFPNELDIRNRDIYDNLARPKDITFISATTENIQARYVASWLRKDGKAADGKKTAIVMCDESLLQTVIHSLPPETGKVNITTGYPLKLSPVASLVTRLIDIQTLGHRKDTDKYSLYHINKLLGHPYMVYLTDKAGQTKAHLNEHKYYYPTREMLSVDEGMTLLFSDISARQGSDSEKAVANLPLLQWTMEVLKTIGRNSRDAGDQLLHESVFRMYTLLGRLTTLTENGELDVDTTTLRRLIKQLTDATTIPFHGEPAVGVQVMGILETRNLDFDHVLLLSCNEGNIPRGINDASFIPYSLRKAYGLTTIDNKVSIYSYYFHSLLQRAKDIAITYNNSTENGHTGEMSRFMLQMMVESGHNIARESLMANNIPAASGSRPIEKSSRITAVLDSMKSISPSAINQYIRCQLQFYFNHVAKIKEPDNNSDNKIDNRIFGNIFHKSAYYIYKSLTESSCTVTKTAIGNMLKNTGKIERIVDQAFKEELFKTDNGVQTPEYNGLQIINREVIIKYLQQLLRIDVEIAPFNIIGLEHEVSDNVELTTSRGRRSLNISGFIDRLDMTGYDTKERTIRVIDYKTGHKPIAKIKAIEEIFSTDNISKKHTDYFLQAMLYSIIISRSGKWNKEKLPVSPALLFIQQSVNGDYDPTLELDGQPMSDIEKYAGEFMKNLVGTLEEIFEPTRPFTPSNDKSRCLSCPYRQICLS